MYFRRRISKFLAAMTIGSCVVPSFNSLVLGMEATQYDPMKQTIEDYNSIVKSHPSYKLSEEEVKNFFDVVKKFAENKGLLWDKNRMDSLFVILRRVLFSFEDGVLYNTKTQKLDDFLKQKPGIKVQYVLKTIKERLFDRDLFSNDLDYEDKLSCEQKIGKLNTSEFIDIITKKIQEMLGKDENNIKRLYVVLSQLSQKSFEFEELNTAMFFSECPICFSENLTDLGLVTLNCGHTLCKNCFFKMAVDSGYKFKCPLCKTDFRSFHYIEERWSVTVNTNK